MMFLRATVTNEIDDLDKEQWVFSLIDSTLVLDHYSRFRRESNRKRKWQRVKHYNRVSRRDCNIALYDVPFDDSVKQRAFDTLVKQIEVSKELPQ